MKSDPTIDEAKVAITRAKQIMQEFGNFQSVSSFIKEAEEVHLKILKAILAISTSIQNSVSEESRN
jgi:hypothetical protein